MDLVTYPSPTDAAIGLRTRADALPDAPETEALRVVDTALTEYGSYGLYKIAWQLGASIVRQTRSFAAHVAASPHPEVRTLVHAFLAALLDEIYGHAVSSAQVFRRVMCIGERAGRELVCSLMSIARRVRDGASPVLTSSQWASLDARR